MSTPSGDRSSYFPSIEKKYGQPMSYWFDQMEQVSDRKYQEQMAYLKENFGFSHTHANALVLYSRGSTTSQRYQTFEDFLQPLDETKQATIRQIFEIIRKKYPKVEQVIAWNQPMIKYQGHYVFGVSAATNHITIAPFDAEIIDDFRPRLQNYHVNKKTIRVPVDWEVDRKLILDIIAAQIKKAG